MNPEIKRAIEAATPDRSIEVCEENILEFFTYIYERQEAWYNRFFLKKERPWCNNEYINTYKFCNVYRELDRSSQWMINNVFLDKNLSEESLFFSIFVYRLFNHPEPFKHIKLPKFETFNKDRFLKDLIYVKEELGIQPINRAAYQVNTYIARGEAYKNYTNLFVGELHKLVPIYIKLKNKKGTKPQELVKLIETIHGLGFFMSHEYYVDSTYLRRYVDESLFPFTENDWTSVLIGSSIGMRFLFPFLSGIKTQTKGIYVLKDISKQYLDSLGDFKYLYYSRPKNKYYVQGLGELSLHQIEFNLCEYFKYQKLKNNIGRVKLFEQKTF